MSVAAVLALIALGLGDLGRAILLAGVAGCYLLIAWLIDRRWDQFIQLSVGSKTR